MNSTSPWGPPCSCTRETSGYSPCSRSRVRVSREKHKAPRLGPPARDPPWRAGHTRAPRRLQRSRRVRSVCGFPRSADHPPIPPPPDLRALENKTEGAEKRYRVMLDGVHYVTAMLTSSLNQYVADDKLKKFSVIKLKDYFANEVNNRKYVPARARRVAPRRLSRESWHPSRFSRRAPRKCRHPFRFAPYARPRTKRGAVG